MKLLTEELRAQLPALYAQEKVEDKMVYIKFFSPFSNWTWFVTEGSQEEDDFFFSVGSSVLKRKGGFFLKPSLNKCECGASPPSSAICISRRSAKAKSQR